MFKRTLMTAALGTVFAGAAFAAPEQVVTVETVQTAPATPVVVATAQPPAAVAMARPAAPAVVDVPMVRDLNTPSKPADKTLRCTEKDDVDMCINKVYQNFMKENGWPLSGKDKKGKTYYFGSAPVMFAKTNAAYGKTLSLAYTEAYMRAVTEFSRSMVLNTSNEVIQSAFADSSTNAREFPTLEGTGRSDWESLYTKMLKLGQAKLDKALRELGVDPSKWDAVDPDQRKKLLENAVINKSTERTSLALGGINVVGNFVHEAADGQAAVGVVIAYSPAIEGVAQSLAMGQKPAIQAVGQPLDQQIPTDAEQLVDMYGPRLMIDDQGPVIVAFSFWSPEQGPANFKSRYREAAFRQAETEASAQIARFLSLSFSGELETEKGGTSGLDVVKSGKDGSIADKTVSQITDRMSERNVARTSARLTGLQTVRRWIGQTPDGHELVGVVKSYSFGNIEYAKSVTEKNRPQQSQPQPQTQDASPEYKASTRQGSVKSAIDVF